MQRAAGAGNHHVAGLKDGGVGVDEGAFGQEAFAGDLVVVLQEKLVREKGNREKKQNV